MRAHPLVRLLSKVEKRPGDACWRWTGARTTTGAGSFREYGQRANATQPHRALWRLIYGEIPAGHVIAHREGCERECMNPQHLQLMSLRDCSARNGRLNAVAGGPKLRELRRKLSDDDIRKITHLYFNGRGWTQDQLARIFGICPAAISHIVKGRTWSDVTGIKWKPGRRWARNETKVSR